MKVQQTDQQAEVQVVGYLELTKVIRTHTPIIKNGHMSIGEMIDHHIMECARNGDEVQDVKLTFSEQHWRDFVHQQQEAHQAFREAE